MIVHFDAGLVEHDVRNPVQFFLDLYHRFLLSKNSKMRTLCLRAMTVVYAKHYDAIGQFGDIDYMVHMLNTTMSRSERDHLLQFIDKLLFRMDNVQPFLDAGGVRIFVDLLTLAHLHTDRAQTPLQVQLTWFLFLAELILTDDAFS